jgi:hypothetical protein
MVADGLGASANILGIRHQYHDILYMSAEFAQLTRRTPARRAAQKRRGRMWPRGRLPGRLLRSLPLECPGTCPAKRRSWERERVPRMGMRGWKR